MSEYPELAGAELRKALEELLDVGFRSIAAYRAAEGVVQDHRVQAALSRLRRDHERHLEELSSLLRELGGEVPGGGVGEDAGPVEEALRRGDVTGTAVLDAVRRAEAELHAAYEKSVERGVAEPIRAALSRHRREEEAHLEWLQEGPLWPEVRDQELRPGGEVSSG